MRRAWKAPTVMPLRAKSAAAGGAGTEKLTQPEPPGAPATKLGFSFEMAFPLSARFD
jgi:hypothetical protein